MASTDTQTKGDVSPEADPADFVLSPKLSFPEKLMMILEKDLAPTAIWFLPGDRTFAIHSKNFSSEVLDKYFQRTKFMSFVRKLNQWGFRRIPGHTVPKGAVAYVHSLFRKGHPELLKDICDRKKTRSKAKAQAAKEAPKPAALEFQQRSSPQSSAPLVESRAAEPSAMVMPPAAASLHPRTNPPQNVQSISGALSEQLQQLIAASNRNSSAAAASSLHAPLLGNLQDHLRAKPTPAAHSAMAPSSSLDLSSILQRELANQLLSQSTSSMYNLGSTVRPTFGSAGPTAASLRNLSTASYLNGGGGQMQDTSANNMTTLQLLQLLGGGK